MSSVCFVGFLGLFPAFRADLARPAALPAVLSRRDGLRWRVAATALQPGFGVVGIWAFRTRTHTAGPSQHSSQYPLSLWHEHGQPSRFTLALPSSYASRKSSRRVPCADRSHISCNFSSSLIESSRIAGSRALSVCAPSNLRVVTSLSLLCWRIQVEVCASRATCAVAGITG